MPEITKIESVEFTYPLEDVTPRANFGLQYNPGETHERALFAVRVHTDTGVTGEYVGGNSPGAAEFNMVADFVVGRNPLMRERLWSEMKRGLRKYSWMGLGPVDIALWDFAGKYHDAPIHELLGTYRYDLPAYASTFGGDDAGGLDSPEAYADFAEECLDMGYHGFKLHVRGQETRAGEPRPEGYSGADIEEETAIVHAVGERVGDEMDLMLDPACQYETFADALEVGRACDEQGFFWYEDPYRDGGVSQHGHKTLRERLETPILQTEHVRGLEPKTDFVAAGATDFVRADPEYDGGITGAMKVAHAAESFGLDVEYHAPGPAQRHCMAATRNSNYYEMALVHPEVPNTTPPVYADGYDDQLGTVDEDGYVSVPEGPGLGVSYDWDYIEDNALGRRVYE